MQCTNLWGCLVRIPYLVEHGVFSSDDVTAITAAFEDCQLALGLTKPSDPAVLALAKRLVELAKQGETNPIRLRDKVLQSFNLEPQSSKITG
jgi:hypothetical protein